jgi:hypothetical protein
LIGGYFFLPEDFLLLVLDLFCLGFVGFLAMMFLVFYVLPPLRHVNSPQGSLAWLLERAL